MKNFILCIFLFFPALSNSQSIQEFYELFTHDYRKSSQNTQTNQVIIDEKNAFIKIQNTKDTDDVVRFKCFTKEDKSKVFGFQYSASQPDLGLFMTRTEFYVFKNKQWEEVSNDVLPSLRFKDYWGNQPLPEGLLFEFNLDLTLPQTGTTILAKSYPAVSVQFPYSNTPKDYTQIFEKRKFKTIKLIWNKKNGKFDIGKKF